MDKKLLGKINENALDNVSGAKMTKKHRVLMVGFNNPTFQENYRFTFPLECYKGGYLIETCTYLSFIMYADEWKKEFDIFVMCSQNEISILDFGVTGTAVKAAMTIFMNYGVKLVFFTNKGAWLRTYNYDGTTADTSVTSLMNISNAYMDFSANPGVFQHSINYPFGTTEILKSGLVANGALCSHFTSTDPNVVFPVQATNGTITANVVAYKPDKYFVISYPAGATGDVATTCYYKLLYSDKLFNILLGKTNNVRLAQDLCHGKKIAAIGVDADVTAENGATLSLRRAIPYFAPIEWGLVAYKMTSALVQFYKNLPGINTYMSHTGYHYEAADKTTIVDEVYTIPSNGLLRLNNTCKAKITSMKTTDDITTFTLKTGNIIQTAPTVGQYIINSSIGIYAGETIDGYIKFHTSDAGKEIKISYTHYNDYNEMLGSLKVLSDLGILTTPAIYTTQGAHAVSPETYIAAEEQGVTICEYGGFFAMARIVNSFCRLHRKMPLPNGDTCHIGVGSFFIDGHCFEVSKETAKTVTVPAMFQCSEENETPYLFYCHDFYLSETSGTSILNNSGVDADWKKGTIDDIRPYAEEMYTWLFTQIQSKNPFWMTRSEYVKRYNQMNKNISYDVAESDGKYTLNVSSSSKETIKGLSFRVPATTQPTVTAKDGTNINMSYTNGMAIIWFDMLAGRTISIEIS